MAEAADHLVEAGAERREDLGDSLLAAGGQGEDPRPSDKDRAGARQQGLSF
jgi:hypothetical protein